MSVEEDLDMQGVEDAFIESHQLRLFAALLTPEVLQKHRAMVHPSVFRSDAARDATLVLLSIFDKVGSIPTHKTYLLEIARTFGMERARGPISFVKQALSIDKFEVEHIYKAELLRLIEICHKTRCASEALEALNVGDLEKGESLLAESQRKVLEVIEVDMADEDEVDRIYAEGGDPVGRGRIFEFPWEGLNALLKGGGARKEFHLFAGAAKTGKSRLALNMVPHFARQGLHVRYVSLEAEAGVMRARLDQILTGYGIEALCSHSGRELIKSRRRELSESGGSLTISRLESNSFTMAAVQSYLMSLSPRPDVVVLDYLELLVARQSRREGNEWSEQKQMYYDAHSVAERLNALVIGLTQGRGDEITSVQGLEGSKRKMDAVDSGWAININSDELKQSGTFGVWCLGNRHGGDREMLKMRTDHTQTNMIVTQL